MTSHVSTTVPRQEGSAPEGAPTDGVPARAPTLESPPPPAPVVHHSRRIEAHGLGVHVTEWGSGPIPIVMLHALGFTGRLFDPLARALAAHYRILCPDIRGHGRTDHPPEGYQYPNLVRDLQGVLQMLHLNKVVLLGHTWGADVAMSFAAAHPKRVHAVILIDGGYKHRRESPGNAGAPTPDTVKSADHFPSIEAAVADARQQLGVPWSTDLHNAIMDSLEIRRDKTVAYRLNDHRWAQIYKALWAYDPSPFLVNMQLPTLIVHPAGTGSGTPQTTVAAFQARAAQLLMHNADLLRLPEADNLSLLSNPELALGIHDFLRMLKLKG